VNPNSNIQAEGDRTYLGEGYVHRGSSSIYSVVPERLVTYRIPDIQEELPHLPEECADWTFLSRGTQSYVLAGNKQSATILTYKVPKKVSDTQLLNVLGYLMLYYGVT
jgi:hypothetical protein